MICKPCIILYPHITTFNYDNSPTHWETMTYTQNRRCINSPGENEDIFVVSVISPAFGIGENVVKSMNKY